MTRLQVWLRKCTLSAKPQCRRHQFFQRSGDEWQARIVVETPCSWSAHRGLITGKSQWSRHAALQLSQWSRHLAVGQCSGGDEWRQIPMSDRDTLQLVRVKRGRVASHVTLVETPCSWSGCSGDEWQVTVVETPCSWSVQRGRVASHSGKDTLQRGTCFTISTTFMAIPLSLPKRSSACESHSHGLPSLGFAHYQHHQQDSGSGGRTGRWAP